MPVIELSRCKFLSSSSLGLGHIPLPAGKLCSSTKKIMEAQQGLRLFTNNWQGQGFQSSRLFHYWVIVVIPLYCTLWSSLMNWILSGLIRTFLWLLCFRILSYCCISTDVSGGWAGEDLRAFSVGDLEKVLEETGVIHMELRDRSLLSLNLVRWGHEEAVLSLSREWRF